MRRMGVLGVGGAAVLAVAGCEGEVVERIVEVEVPVETVVEKTVEVPVETIVEKTVEVPVETIVEVEKIVEVEVSPMEPMAEDDAPAGQADVWRIGIFEDVTTHNFFNVLGPGQTAWNFYAFLNRYPSLYGLSDLRFDWVPILADGFPGPFTEEGDFVTATVSMKQGPVWSDGQPITAHDVAYSVNTVLELEMMEGNWASIVDSSSVAMVEALDDYTVKSYFHSTPGLARWQFGLSGTQFIAKHFWEPLLTEAIATSEDKAEQRAAVFAIEPENEPTAGEMTFVKWESGAFVQVEANENYYFAGSTYTEYANGAYKEEKPGEYEFTAYGDAEGDVLLEVTRAPAAPTVIYSVYPSQDAAVLAMQNGEIDYMLTPLGLARGFQEQLAGREDVKIIANVPNGIRYLGFNTRRQPMDSKAFRQSVSILTDKEYVTGTVLAGVADPAYTMVPPGNGFWYNPDVVELGKGMTREERINAVVALLKDAGFSWDTEPAWDEAGGAVVPRGDGLRLPDGTLVPELQIVAPSAGYDPLRATYAIWIEQWLNEAGIPARAKLQGFNVLIPIIFNTWEFDMWILGWGLTVFPDYLNDFFNSEFIGDDQNNAGGFTNADFDAAAEQLIVETDITRAREIAFELQRILADESPYMLLFTTQILEPLRSNVNFGYESVIDGVQNYFQSMNGPLATTAVE